MLPLRRQYSTYESKHFYFQVSLLVHNCCPLDCLLGPSTFRSNLDLMARPFLVFLKLDALRSKCFLLLFRTVPNQMVCIAAIVASSSWTRTPVSVSLWAVRSIMVSILTDVALPLRTSGSGSSAREAGVQGLFYR